MSILDTILDILAIRYDTSPVPVSVRASVLVSAPAPVPSPVPARVYMDTSEPHEQHFFNFAKNCTLSCLSKFYSKEKFHRAVFKMYIFLRLKSRLFLAGHSVAMVTYCVTKIIPTRSPVIGQFFDTMIVASIDLSLLFPTSPLGE